jgi:uncharacterized membrane protein YwaF
MTDLGAVVLFHVSVIVIGGLVLLMNALRMHTNQIEMAKYPETQRLLEPIFWSIVMMLAVIFNSCSLLAVLLREIAK